MRIADFRLERFFARWEFTASHHLCASDVQGVPMAELVAMADGECRAWWEALALGRQAAETGGPSPEVAAQIGQMQSRLRTVARIQLGLLAVAVFAMATARYW